MPTPRIVVSASPIVTSLPAVETAEAPSPPAAFPPEKPSAVTMAAWQDLIRERLDRVKRYPDVARLRRQQGIAYLRFVMARDGSVLSAAIGKSSGILVLDEETLALIQRAVPLPRPPAEMSGERFELVMPIQFSLR